MNQLQPETASIHNLPVAIVGAGPIGLAAAAHLAEKGRDFVLLETGETVGSSLASVAHVNLFTPWRYTTDAASVRLLRQSGWTIPDPEEIPSAGDLVERYLRPLSRLPAIAPRIRLGAQVLHISRRGFDKVKTKGREEAPFVIRYRTKDGSHDLLASAVIDASGTWASPSPLGANGLPALGEDKFASRISYGMPDVLGRGRRKYLGKRTAVVGSGHSAAGTILALAELAAIDDETKVVWIVRGHTLARVFGGGENDGFPARGRIGARLRQLTEAGKIRVVLGFRVSEVRGPGPRLELVAEDGQTAPGLDEIVCATGSRPDLSLSRELRLRTDPVLESTDLLAPLIDPNVHSCGSVRPHGFADLSHPESGFFAIGAKSYGRAPNFLMATGYEQARSVVAALTGDLESASRIELQLPETGVCSTQFDAAQAEPVDSCSASSCAPESTESSPCAPACGTAVSPKIPVTVSQCCG